MLKFLFRFKIFFSLAQFNLFNPMGTHAAGLRHYFSIRGGPNSGQKGDQHCETVMKHVSLQGREGRINNNSLLQSFFFFFSPGVANSPDNCCFPASPSSQSHKIRQKSQLLYAEKGLPSCQGCGEELESVEL